MEGIGFRPPYLARVLLSDGRCCFVRDDLLLMASEGQVTMLGATDVDREGSEVGWSGGRWRGCGGRTRHPEPNTVESRMTRTEYSQLRRNRNRVQLKAVAQPEARIRVCARAVARFFFSGRHGDGP